MQSAEREPAGPAPAADPALMAERDFLRRARDDLRRMRDHTLSLTAQGGDPVSRATCRRHSTAGRER